MQLIAQQVICPIRQLKDQRNLAKKCSLIVRECLLVRIGILQLL